MGVDGRPARRGKCTRFCQLAGSRAYPAETERGKRKGPRPSRDCPARQGRRAAIIQRAMAERVVGPAGFDPRTGKPKKVLDAARWKCFQAALALEGAAPRSLKTLAEAEEKQERAEAKEAAKAAKEKAAKEAKEAKETADAARRSTAGGGGGGGELMEVDGDGGGGQGHGEAMDTSS